MDWLKRKKIEWGISGGLLPLPGAADAGHWTGLGWAGLGWAAFSFLLDRRHGMMYACLVLVRWLVTCSERTNERMHVLRPHHILGEPLTTLCVEPLARSGGGGDMCGLPAVEGITIILSLHVFLTQGRAIR